MQIIQSALTALLGLFFITLIPFQEPQPEDPCACEVVNTFDSSSGTGDCKCTDPGTGSKIPPFTVGVAVYPDGAPSPGVCTGGECEDKTGSACTFTSIQVSVTIAICARACTGHASTDLGVDWKKAFGPGWANQPDSGAQAFNSTVAYTMPPPNAPNANICGSGPWESTITFNKKNGTKALQLTFEFACGKCPAES